MSRFFTSYATMLQFKTYICNIVANMSLRFSYLLAFIFIASAPANGQSIQGTVIDEETKKGIPFAKIYFVDLDEGVLADSTGLWTFEKSVRQKEQHVVVSAPGYKTLHADFLADSQIELKFSLSPLHHELDEVIINNGGYLHRESITNIESHKLQNLNKIPSANLGESIAKIPGVYQTNIGQGISKPVIRGLSGSSVVTYVNTLRIENQQWGNDHGLPITSLGIGQVEVIKGPASLLFGADALGGVVYFIDEPYAPKNSLTGFAETRFEHNSLGTSNSGGIRFSKDKFRMNIYGGYDNFADYATPDQGQVFNSRFNQTSAKLSMGYRDKNWLLNVRYNFFYGHVGLPGHSHDSIPDPSSFYTQEQNRISTIPAQKTMNHLLSAEHKIFFKKQEVHTTIGHTRNGLKEHEEKVFFPDIIMDLNNTLLNVKWKIKAQEHWHYFIGTQGMYQMNRNGIDAAEILVPDSETIDAGIYGLARYAKNKWRVLIGGRFDTRMISISESDFSRRFDGYNFSAGTVRTSEKSTMRLNISSGYRAPNVTELLADGVHHGSFRYERGNTALASEAAVQIDLSQAFHLDDFELLINPFYNRIQNYIYLQEAGEIVDGYPVYNWTQTPFAQLYGLDFGIHYHPHGAHWLHLQTSISTVFAEDADQRALPRIPQSRIQNRVIVNIKKGKKFKVNDLTIDYTYLFKQDRIGILEMASPSYHMLNVGFNFKLDHKQAFLFAIGARNVLNKRFIDHLSGLRYLDISGPGINGYISIRYEFKRQTK